MKKKSLLITIIVLLILLILAGGVFAYIYFATDLLKTDKELFAKYVMQMGDKENGIFPNMLVDYGNKKISTPYENNGTFNANTDILSDTSTNQNSLLIESLLDYGNNTNISFNGKVDSKNKKVEEDITINYTDTVNLPFKYKQVGDVYGVQADFISPSYIAVENNNLQDFFQKMGVSDISSIPNKIEAQELQSLKFTEEELTHISEQYINPMFEGISEDKFSSIQNNDGSNSYALDISNVEIRDIVVKMLQTLSNDTMMINKINNIISEIYQTDSYTIGAEDIQELIDSLNAEQLNEVNVEIVVTQTDGITNKLTVETSGVKVEFDIQKTNANVVYTINIIGNDVAEITTRMSYAGLNSNTVTETINMTINIPENVNVTYTLNNTVNFVNTIEIAEFDTNTAILNNYSAEQIQPFLMQVFTMIAQTNINQMSQIGFSQEFMNPMFMWVVWPSLVQTSGIVDRAQDAIGEDIQREEVEANNSIFTSYEGQISGSGAKSLCQTVNTHNLTSEDTQKVNVKLGEAATATSFVTNINDINQIQNSIQSAGTYNVTLSYDSATGYVCEIGIVDATAIVDYDSPVGETNTNSVS